MKPTVISAFEGDSIIIRCALYDEQNQPYSPLNYKIHETWVIVEGIGQYYGSIIGNVLQFIIPSNVTEANKSSKFAIQIYDGEHLQFTVAHGTIQVLGRIHL